jgi:hypothetical protein
VLQYSNENIYGIKILQNNAPTFTNSAGIY